MINGEIVFEIADTRQLEIDFGEILPTKIINKGEVIAMGRKSPKNLWIYKISYDNEEEYYESLEKMAVQLLGKQDYIDELTRQYEEVGITIYVRSDFAQIGYSIPNHILKKFSALDCDINFDILSFGRVEE